jgi:multisubunit Na+/H+ antiporter MnhG subunit
VLAFVFFTGPAASHALVKAAYASGCEANVEKRND